MESEGLRFEEHVTEDARRLIAMILKAEPEQRPSFEQIFETGWMRRHEKEFGIDLKSYLFVPKAKKSGKSGGSAAQRTELQKDPAKPSEQPPAEERRGAHQAPPKAEEPAQYQFSMIKRQPSEEPQSGTIKKSNS